MLTVGGIGYPSNRVRGGRRFYGELLLFFKTYFDHWLTQQEFHIPETEQGNRAGQQSRTTEQDNRAGKTLTVV